MKRFKRELRIAAALLAIALVAAAIYVEIRYALIRTSPRVDLAELADDPSIIAVINPALALEQIRPLITERAGFPVPDWIVRRVLPYEATVVTISNYDDDEIDLTLFLNLRRFGPAIERQVNAAGLRQIVPEIHWNQDGLVEISPGVLSAAGSVPMELEAQEAAWFLWSQKFKPTSMPFQGTHFIEVVMDNRDGGAYLAVASILQAFDISLDKSQTDISLSSLKFVTKARMYVDITPADLLLCHLAIEVRPDTVNRLGVINLKVGIDELMSQWGETLSKEHGLTLEGKSSWNDNVMLFNYRLKSAGKALQLALNGELF